VLWGAATARDSCRRVLRGDERACWHAGRVQLSCRETRGAWSTLDSVACSACAAFVTRAVRPRCCRRCWRLCLTFAMPYQTTDARLHPVLAPGRRGLAMLGVLQLLVATGAVLVSS
jgi:hypothetical protein